MGLKEKRKSKKHKLWRLTANCIQYKQSSLLEKYTDAQSRILQSSLENEEFKEQNAKLGAENSKLKDEIKKLRSR